MKRSVLLIATVLGLTFCKGPNSGPLVKESFDSKKEEAPFMQGQKSTGPAKPGKISDSVEPCQGCIKISELLAKKKDYKGKEVKVTGKVVKFNAGIMERNWVHIQDGSESDGEFDLTITTMASVAVGDIVTFTGKITLEKDFGYGYFYDILMEDGVLAPGTVN